VKTTSKTTDSTNETKYVAPAVGNENGNPKGTEASGPPEPASTVPAATPAPTPVATPTATPKPTCPNPNADATIKSQADLDYPDIARQQGATGTAQVKVTLDAEGNPVDVAIYKSTGNSLLDQSALKAAKATTYVPEIVNCVKTAGSYLFRADFDGQ
jgi:protein TonB